MFMYVTLGTLGTLGTWYLPGVLSTHPQVGVNRYHSFLTGGNALAPSPSWG